MQNLIRELIRYFAYPLVFFGVGLVAAPALAAEQVVKIGHVAPLTGPQSHFGLDNEAGAKLAIADLNAMGIQLDGVRARFELLSEDDQSSKRQASVVAEKLCRDGVKGVVGHMNSSTTLVASRLYYDCGLPMITPSATNPRITAQGFDSVFRLIANDNIQALALADEALSRGLRNVVVFDDGSNYGKPLADLFVQRLQAKGGNLLARISVPETLTDFSGYVNRVIGESPDLIFFAGMDSQAGELLKALRRAGSNIELMGGDGICTLEMFNLSDRLADKGVVCAQGGLPITEMPGGKKFKRRFEKTFGMPIQLYAPYVYDATMAIGMAMKDAGSADPRKYLPSLRKLRFQGVIGGVAFDSHGDMKNPAVSFYTFDSVKGKTFLKLVE